MYLVITPLENLVISLIAGGLGGTFAHVAGTELIHRIRSPDLQLERTKTHEIRAGDNSKEVHQITIRNQGKKAATNCRAILSLEGKLTIPYEAPVETLERLVVRVTTPLTWSASDHKTKITLNQDELGGIEIFRTSQGGTSLEFPSEFGWERPATIEVQKTYIGPGEEFDETVSKQSIGISEFNRINWYKQELDITAENTSGITCRLEFNRTKKGLDCQVKDV